jgi:hypothetical protein
LKKWDETLDADARDKEAIETFIKQLESPFGYFDALRVEYGETEEAGDYDQNNQRAADGKI